MMRFPVALAMFLLLCCGGATPTAADVSDRPLVILLLPGTSLNDWRSASAPMLHRVMETGAMALMNTRTARLPNDLRRETPESAALTLGAGSRAAGGGEIIDFHPARDASAVGRASCGELSTRRTGIFCPPGGAVNVQWPLVVRENRFLGYDLLPGNLGSALRAHGISPVAGGGPLAAAVAADRSGIVYAFKEGRDPPHPLPPVLVWDAGTDIASADAVIRSVSAEVQDRRGRMIVVSPCVSDAQFQRGQRLAPIVVWGDGVPTGLLYSPSTHHAGLITNTDVAPSVTAFIGGPAGPSWLPTAAFGRPWTSVVGSQTVPQVVEYEQDCYRQARGMKMLPLTAVLLGLLTAVSIFRRRQDLSPVTPGWLPGVIIFALLASPTPWAVLIWTGALSLLFWVARRKFPSVPPVLLTSLGIVLTLVVDMLTGDRLMQHSLLGYSAVEGARYYGIGNEAMGPLIGSALVAAAVLWKRSTIRLVVTAGALFGLSLLIGLPSAGAKAGGLLVALAAFATFLWTAAGGRLHPRLLLALVTTTLLTLALVSVGDWHHQAGTRTHVGAAMERIATGGTGEAWDIIRRKILVEGRLAYHSAWAVPLWVSVFGLARDPRRRAAKGDAKRGALFSGGVAAVIACFALNDAGVVAAALCGTIVLSGLGGGVTEEKPMSPTAVAA